MNAIVVKDLVKTYKSGVQALKGIDLTIHKGDFFALLGANGAGKTTFIGILTDLVNKTSGSIEVFGKSIDTHLDEIKMNVGVVPQEFNFNIFEKVIDIVVTQAGYFGVPKDEAEKRAEDILKKLSLWDKRNSKSNALSGGMKRRLMIARALIHQPKFLILDEPTAGVDVELRHSMWEYLRQLNKEGVTILLTTHYLEEVEQMCNRMAMIKDGVIVKEGNVKTILKSIEGGDYVLTVDHVDKKFVCDEYMATATDEHTVEVQLPKNHTLSDVVIALNKKGVKVLDVRPKSNRIEQFFLDVLNK